MAVLDGLGKALATLRKERRLTQTELAQRAEVSRANLSCYESGSIKPKVETLDRILDALDVDVLSFGQKIREIQGLESPGAVGQWEAQRTAFLVVPLRRRSHETDDDSDLVELGARYAAHIVDELFSSKTDTATKPEEEEGGSEEPLPGIESDGC